MAKTKYTDKTMKDLQKLLTEKRKVLRDFYFAVAGGKMTDVKSAKNTRKDIARILTELHKSKETGKV